MKSYLFTFISLLLISCSSENFIEVQDTKSYEFDARKFWEDVNTIENDFHINGVPSTLDQAKVDYYAAMAGYGPEEITLQFVLDVIEVVGLLEENDFETILEQHEENEFVKSSLLTLSSGEWIENIEEDPSFLELQSEQKDFLLISNAIVKEYSENNSNFHNVIYRTHNTMGGILIGGLIGTGLGGFPGGTIGGAVIGAMVGIVSGHKQ